MNRKLPWLLGLPLLATAMACGPGQPDDPPDVPVVPVIPDPPPDYLIGVRVLDADKGSHDYVRRDGNCTVSGTDYSSKPVTIRQGGVMAPWLLTIAIHAPTDVPIAVPTKEAKIVKFNCSIYGGSEGEFLICDVVKATTGGAAPVTDMVDHATVGAFGVASCHGNIQVGS